MSNFGKHVFEKPTGIRSDRAAKLADIGPRKGLGEIYLRRIPEPGKQASAAANPDIALSQIVNGVAVNGAAPVLAEILVANATITTGDQTASGTVATITPGTDAVTPGSITVYATLDDTDNTVLELTDGPVPIVGESGVTQSSGPGLDGLLRDQFGREWGTVNYFTGDVEILDLPADGLLGTADITVDYRLVTLFNVNQSLLLRSFAASEILNPVPMEDEQSIWLIANGSEILIRAEILATEDGVSLASA